MSETPRQAMDRMFTDKGRFQRWLEIEASLARAQAKVGLIPAEVAEQITAKADIELLDLAQYEEMYRQTQHPLVAMLRRQDSGALLSTAFIVLALLIVSGLKTDPTMRPFELYDATISYPTG